MISALKMPVNISVPWKRICWHLISFSCHVTEVRFWTDWTYWQGVLWKNSTGQLFMKQN